MVTTKTTPCPLRQTLVHHDTGDEDRHEPTGLQPGDVVRWSPRPWNQIALDGEVLALDGDGRVMKMMVSMVHNGGELWLGGRQWTPRVGDVVDPRVSGYRSVARIEAGS